jgi:hypothetical protein
VLEPYGFLLSAIDKIFGVEVASVIALIVADNVLAIKDTIAAAVVDTTIEFKLKNGIIGAFNCPHDSCFVSTIVFETTIFSNASTTSKSEIAVFKANN